MPSPPLPQAAPPATGSEKFFNFVARVMTTTWNQNIFVWLPAVSTDPNTGPVYGLMPVLVLADPASRHIRHLVAPSYTHNRLFGQTVTGRYYFYPDDDSQLYATASFSQHTNREFKIRYENTSALDGILYVRGESYYCVDGSLRFFGIGPATTRDDEAGYTGKDTVVRGTLGVNFSSIWRFTFGARYKRFVTGNNIVPNTQDIMVRYAGTPGLMTEKTVAPELRLIWDSRDLPITPSRGSSGELWFEMPNNVFRSEADFVRYGALGKKYVPWSSPSQLTVVHALYEWANGRNIPFYEMPRIGGEKTLRGFGDGRFSDRGRLVLNLEHRAVMASLALMGIQTNFEISPFLDLGTVFPTLPQARLKDANAVAGLGFRAAVKPNVVGNVEVGIGREGPAVFVGINYPY
jgi:outer membrane protein assembly factor BamA